MGERVIRGLRARRLPRYAAMLACAVALPFASGCTPILPGTHVGGGTTHPVVTPKPAPKPTPAPSPTTPVSTTLSPLGVAGGWTLAADDEFNATALNSGMWSIGEPWNSAPGFEEGPDAYCPMPQSGLVTEGGGALSLTAKAVPTAGKPLRSCFITSRNKYSFTHGYLEARVKLPSSPGLWPAFWLLGNGTGAQGWPGTGEIDMFEFVNNGDQNGVPYFTVHYGGNCPGGHCQKTQDSPYPKALANYAGRWITYGIARTSTSLTIYIDGQRMETFTRNMTNPQGQALAGVLFDSPMHVRFDLSAGGWAKDPGHASQPGTFAVDYVRAWS